MESVGTWSIVPFTPIPNPKHIRIDELADEIGELAGYLNAANCRFLELIAEFDQLAGWNDQGALSCAHWLNWRCGIGLNAAREKVRAARALGQLPKIRAAFAAGRISYSKVRAMTRVATPENESYLLDIALHGTASHVEKLVRGYRWRIRHDEEAAEDRKRRDGRYCRYHWDDEGCLVVSARLTPEQGALVIKALEAGQEWVAADVTAVTSDHPPRVRGALANDDPPDPTEKTAAEVTAETYTPVLPQSDSTADDNPDFAYSFASSITAETFDTPPAAERPQRRADALALMAETFLARGPAAMNGGDKHQIILIADAAVLRREASAGACRLEDGPNIGIETMRRLGCDAAVSHVELDDSGEPLNIGRKSRTIPPPMRRALLLRDGGCRFPGCTNRRFVDGHHIRHWSDGGETSLENLVAFCRRHHRLFHEGSFTVRRIGPNRFEFRTPDGELIPDAAPPPEHIAEPSFDCTIDKDTSGCAWDGESMDYCEAVLALQEADDRLKH